MASELKTKAVQAGVWSFIEALGQRSVQFVVGIILARLLLPEQFGLIGMLMVFTAIAQTFLDSGFGAALIQKQDITETDINSIFYFNIFVGIVVVCCLFVLSPWVAKFYNQPILSPLLRVISITVLVNAFGLIQNVLLTKALDFKTQSKVTIVAGVFSGVIGVCMAYSGFGVWSIVGQQIASSISRTILLWGVNKWRPSWIFSFRSLWDMFHFGSKLLASGLLNTFFDNIYLIIIGKLFPPADLGYFTRAKNLQQLPSRTLASTVGRVTFPVFSTIQDDPEKLKKGMKKVLQIIVFINFPMMLGLAAISHSLVLLLLTEKWLPCIPYLRLLCIVGVMYPIHLINLNVLQALGKSNLFLRLEVIKKVLIVISIVITYRWGILAMIYGQIITSLLAYYLNAYYNKKFINYSIFEQVRDISPYLFTAIFMAILVCFVAYLPFRSSLLLLICQIATGSLIYIALCYFLKLKAFIEVKCIIVDKLSLRSTIQ